MASNSLSIYAYLVSAGVKARNANATGCPNWISAAPNPDLDVSLCIVTSSSLHRLMISTSTQEPSLTSGMPSSARNLTPTQYHVESILARAR